MTLKWIILYAILPVICGLNKCPHDCSCSLDEIRRLVTLCVKGGMKAIPVKDIDPDVNVIIIKGPRNSITIGPLFTSFIKLEVLRLIESNIPAVGKNSFWGVKSLRILDLSKNNITAVSDENFRGQDGLHELDLSKNKIYKMASGPFCHLKFKFLDKDEFYDLKHLTILRLDGNQLSVVVDGLFRMQKSLQYLDLSNNRLAKVPNDSFENLSNLTYLDLSYNKLVRLEPESVRHLNNLQGLNISGNIQMDLHEIRETFEMIPYLKALAVADMGILPVGLLVPFRQLRYLNISGNHLDNMSLLVISPCEELEFLDLSRNQLKGFNGNTANRIKEIRNVMLDNNPLICDYCHMGTLIDIVRHLEWDTYPTCFLPKKLRGAEINDLDVSGLETCIEFITDEEHDAASTSHNFLEKGGLNALAILVGIIFVLIAVIILTMAACSSKHKARYYTNEDKKGDGDASCLAKDSEVSVIRGKEINFKFPLEDRVCTIDEIILPPSSTTTPGTDSKE